VTPRGVERRLAAILAADVVGYSRLVGEDEEGTIARLKVLREEVVDPSIAKHNGRIVKTTGDGLLAEFASVVDAVRNAVEVQRAMAERNAGLPEGERIEFRVGINLGDIVIDGDDILGDGVNVAARLEGLAEPGGVCVSGTAFDQVRDKMDVGYEYLGEQEVKNIERPVRVYRVLLEPEAAGTVIGAVPARRQLWQQPVLAVLGLLLLVIGGFAIWNSYRQPDFEPADPGKMAYALPEKPSIAVLPLDNLSGDPDQDYLGDGLTENIIAVLSTSPDLFVIARNSSFTYKDKATKVQEVAEQLGVRYVLEGSVQRADNRLRVTAQLVDAIDGRHLWAERYDGDLKDLKDLFAIQDDITQKILVAMHVELLSGDSARRAWAHVGDLETYRLYMQAMSIFQTNSPESNRETERLLREALRRQPENGVLISFKGWVHWQKVFLGLSKVPGKDLAVAREYAENSLSLFEENFNAYTLLATLDMFARKHESAIANADRAIELAPTSGYNIAIAGWVKNRSGQPREGMKLLKRAMRLEPYHWEWIPLEVAFVHLTLGEYDKARAISEGLLASSVVNVTIHPIALQTLAAISVFEGDVDRASQHFKKSISIQPRQSVATVRRRNYYMKNQAFLERFLDALRRAGLPG